jgi:hypothetical protein
MYHIAPKITYKYKKIRKVPLKNPIFTYTTFGPARFVPVGVVVISLFLLIYTLLTSVCRLSKAVDSLLFLL